MEKRSALLRDLRKGSITTACNNLAASITRLSEYGKASGKKYVELHVTDAQMDALTKDKLRWLANLGHNASFTHGQDAPYFDNIRLIPQSPDKLVKYIEAKLPEE